MEDPTFPNPNLPNDVIVEILTWLPVKPLLKFKCVCKSWRALISSSKFVKSHLENSKLERNFSTRRLLMQDGGYFKQLSANSMLYEPVSEASGWSSPFQLDCDIVDVLGSCNGLLCLGVVLPLQNYCRVELMLWNPSTRIRKELPGFELNAHTDAKDGGTNKYGFGYDKSSDDYKVVRFCGGGMGSPESEWMLQVYSLRNDQWKTLGRHCLEMSGPATFVNGKLYWIGYQINYPEDEDCAVCFDLETEEYEILQLPNGFVYRYGLLAECGGSLRLMCFHSSGTDVWSLDGCGVGNENWAKVVTVPSVEDFGWPRFCVLYGMRNLFLFEKKEGACRSMAIFDAKDGSIRYHEIRNKDYFILVDENIESLVSPLGW